MKINQQTTKTKGYACSDVLVKLPGHDTDIVMQLPNGDEFTLQFRVEGPSLDILLPETNHVHNWVGDDMKPARVPKGQSTNVHNADQLMIPLAPDSFEN